MIFGKDSRICARITLKEWGVIEENGLEQLEEAHAWLK
jgi:hypothetical protein